ncbi:cell division protein PerM [Brevibacterium spongiae]|uniref:DUF6350 family protein n=1 Tax=Brevibacterium spongiae TaxID=2909672 RepID=A0ABY5SVY8_9MICO|nr:DUF6350 family protein [Brevibacterium spongiae]UVI37261.1 DUF6350 family protein [Brevibacterium spongiae]
MHTSPHPQPYRRAILAALLEVVKIDLIVVPAGFVAAIAFWIIGLGSQLPYSAIPEWAFALWAAVTGLSVSTLGFEFSIAPTLVTIGLWFLVAGAAKRLVEGTAVDAPEPDEDEPGRWWGLMTAALGTFVVAYAGPLLAFAIIVGNADFTPFGFLRLLLFLLTAVGCGFLRVRGIGDIPGLRILDDEVWASGIRLARRLLWGALAVAALVIAGGFVLRWDAATDSMQAYSSPLAAGIGLLIVQILFAPGILYSALSWSAGTGVVVGGGDVSSAFRATSSQVPDVPVLQLLSGEYPAWTVAAPAVLVLLGLLCTILGRNRAREVADSSWSGLGVAAGFVFAAFVVFGLFSRGALGPVGLSGFGPTPLLSATAMTAWIAVGLAAGLLLIRLSSLQQETADGDADFGDDFAGFDHEDADHSDVDLSEAEPDASDRESTGGEEDLR